MGTPLKDWDIKINYGIKTGLNEAFIISGAKRNEILANCKSEDEKQRTDELIRPLLRQINGCVPDMVKKREDFLQLKQIQNC